jgi:Plasmid pRiA4b ORF-3-like protein
LPIWHMFMSGRKRYLTLLSCVDGANACPPEDCGGVGGYAHLIEVLSDSDNEDHEDMLAWLGIEDPKEFDPAFFNPKRVVFRAHKTLKRR